MVNHKLSKRLTEKLEELITIDFLLLTSTEKIKKDIGVSEEYLKYCFKINRVPNKVYNLENLFNEKLGFYLPQYHILKGVLDYCNKGQGIHIGIAEEKMEEYVIDSYGVDEVFIKVLGVTFLKIFNSIATYSDLECFCHFFIGHMETILLKDINLVNEDLFNNKYEGNDEGLIGMYLDVMVKEYTVDLLGLCKYLGGSKITLLHLSSYLFGLKESNTFYGKEDSVVKIFKDIIIDAFKTMDYVLLRRGCRLEVCEHCTEIFFIGSQENSDDGIKCVCGECLKIRLK